MKCSYCFYSSDSNHTNCCTRNFIYKKRIRIVFLREFHKTFIYNKNSVFII